MCPEMDWSGLFARWWLQLEAENGAPKREFCTVLQSGGAHARTVHQDNAPRRGGIGRAAARQDSVRLVEAAVRQPDAAELAAAHEFAVEGEREAPTRVFAAKDDEASPWDGRAGSRTRRGR